MAGHLINKCGGIDWRTIEKLEKESRQLAKGSFTYAWVPNNLKAERERGITVDVSLWKFETSKCHFTTINAQGHRDFIENMITGRRRGMLLSLLLSLSGKFEAGIQKNGQTHSLILLSYTFGVKQMIVAVNKMDETTVNSSEKLHNDFKTETGRFLKRTVFNHDNIQFIPISWFNGDNTTERSKNMPCTRSRRSMMRLTTTRSLSALLRSLCVFRYRMSPRSLALGLSPLVVLRRILKPGMMILFAPCGSSPNTCLLRRTTRRSPRRSPGDNIVFNVRTVTVKDIRRGHVASDAKNKPTTGCENFTARVIIMATQADPEWPHACP